MKSSLFRLLFGFTSVVVSVALAAGGVAVLTSGLEKSAAGSGGEAKDALKRAIARLPMHFEPNRGQTDPGVNFLSRGRGYTMFLTPTGAVMSLVSSQTAQAGQDKAGPGGVLRMELIDSNPAARVAGRSALPGKVNYFTGAQALKNIPTFGRVHYRGVYPGIDLVYYGNQGQLEYDFIVSPGADPKAVQMNFEGADRLSIQRSGDLAIHLGSEKVVQRKPYIYQKTPGGRVEVPGRFTLDGTRVGFQVGRYDSARPLVIDPVLSYSTYLGGNGVDVGFGVAVDSAGNGYVTGSNTSSNFPTKGTTQCPTTPPTTSSLQCDQPGGDAFVTKVAPGGGSLVWSTYLGGTRTDQGWDIGVDADGNVYVAGSTESGENPLTVASDSFPTTPQAYDLTCGTDGRCNETAVHDPSAPNCPPLGPGPCGTSGPSDTFLSKLGPDGDKLLYSTFLGGSDQDQDVNPTSLPGHMDLALRGPVAFIAANTGSADFPTTANAHDRICGTAGCSGNLDAYLAAIDTSGTGAASLVYSSFIGGDGNDEAKGVALDDTGDAYVAGTTAAVHSNPLDPFSAKTNNFPTTEDALQPSYRGGESDGFAVRVDTSELGLPANGDKLVNGGGKVKLDVPIGVVYSTYLGGGGTDQAWDVAVKTVPNHLGKPAGGIAYFTGYTDSGDDPATPEVDGAAPYFPTTAGAFQTTFNGRSNPPDGRNIFLSGDAFVMALDRKGSSLVYSTFLGGNEGDTGAGITLDSAGNAYIAGYVTCENTVKENPDVTCSGSFPMVNPIPGQETMDGTFLGPELHNSPTDIFVAKVNPAGSALVYSTYLRGNNFDRGYAVAVRETLNAEDQPVTEAYITGRVGSTGFGTPGSAVSVKPSGLGGRDGYLSMITD